MLADVSRAGAPTGSTGGCFSRSLGRSGRMTMSVGHAETAHRVALEVEFDQHHRLFAHHPTIVAWFDGHDLRRLVFGGAPVAVFDVDLAPLEKADVRVHATVRADDRLHVDRPAKSGRIDHALHASCAGASDLELDMADLPPLGSFHAGGGRIGCLRSTLSSVMPFRNPAGLPTSLRLFRRHGRSAFQRPFWNQSSSLRERQTRWTPALRKSGTAVTRRAERNQCKKQEQGYREGRRSRGRSLVTFAPALQFSRQCWLLIPAACGRGLIHAERRASP